MQGMASELGLRGEILALNVHEKLAGLARVVSTSEEILSVISDADIVLMHYSLGSIFNDCFLKPVSGKKVLLFHNLTPPEWFDDYNTRVAKDLRQGICDLSGVVAAADAVWSDSTYNKKFINTDREVLVLPYVFDEDRWSKLEANSGIAAALSGHSGTNILHVGRVAPNKCIQDVIKSFYFYHHKIDPDSRLWLVGGDIDTEIYKAELVKLTYDLGLKEAVTFVGSVSDEELKAFYQSSDLYLLMSEHEGFCVPLLEAMAASIPVVAFAQEAVVETGKDYIYAVEEKNYPLIAELMSHVISQASPESCLGRFNRASFKENFKRCLECA